jgi:hypothetical protein
MRVGLSGIEMRYVAYVGVLRQQAAVEKGRPEPYGAPPRDPTENHALGAAAEYVVSRTLGRHWYAVLERVTGAPDVFPNIHVRSTTYANGRLILHDTARDPEDGTFVLVTGTPPTLTMVGWIHGANGKQTRWWGDPARKGRPAFFVPQAALRPMSELLPGAAFVPGNRF